MSVELPLAPQEVQPVAEQAPVRVIDVGHNQYETNLPENVPLYSEHYETSRGSAIGESKLDIIPKNLDAMPEGDFFIQKTPPPQPRPHHRLHRLRGEVRRQDAREARARGRHIRIRATEHGKVVGSEAFDRIGLVREGDAKVLSKIGFEFTKTRGDRYAAKTVLTPNTLVVAAKTVGVEVELFPDHQTIPGDKFLGAYAEGKYPLSTLSERDGYIHDVLEHHFTGTLLGGDALRDGLGRIARETLATGDETAIAELAVAIDFMTPHVAFFGRETSKSPKDIEKNYKNLLYHASEIGFTQEETDALISTIQERRVLFDMQPLDLAPAISLLQKRAARVARRAIKSAD